MKAMNCNDHEKNIFLYAELTDHERKDVLSHIETCVHCQVLFREVNMMNEILENLALDVPAPANAAGLTHTIMEEIAHKQSRSTAWHSFLQQYFLRTSLASLSVILIVFLAVEVARSPKSEMQNAKLTVAREVKLDIQSFKTLAKRKKLRSLTVHCKPPLSGYRAYANCIKQKFK